MNLYSPTLSGNEITEIKLCDTNLQCTSKKAGIVRVKYNEMWLNVCSKTNVDSWEKRAANVSCQQLNFLGGWPLDINETGQLRSNKYLCKFNCGGGKLIYFHNIHII